MFLREELLTSPEYWFEGEQNELYRQISNYLQSQKINKSELAKRLNISKGRVSQILDGEYNYSLKKLIEICLAIGIVPQIKYTPIEIVISEDRRKRIEVFKNASAELSNEFSEWAKKNRFPIDLGEEIIGENNKLRYSTFTGLNDNILKNSKSNSTLIA